MAKEPRNAHPWRVYSMPTGSPDWNKNPLTTPVWHRASSTSRCLTRYVSEERGCFQAVQPPHKMLPPHWGCAQAGECRIVKSSVSRSSKGSQRRSYPTFSTMCFTKDVALGEALWGKHGLIPKKLKKHCIFRYF